MACDDTARSHIFSGRQYEPSKGCLDEVSVIDVVAGPEPEQPCPPRCIVSLADDAGASAVYVSTMCPPYPVYPYDSDASGDPRCAVALALYGSNTTCETDGAVWVQAPPPDAGSDSAAAPDGGASDAPAGGDGASPADGAAGD